jgi:hypothetical protein
LLISYPIHCSLEADSGDDVDDDDDDDDDDVDDVDDVDVDVPVCVISNLKLSSNLRKLQ